MTDWRKATREEIADWIAHGTPEGETYRLHYGRGLEVQVPDDERLAVVVVSTDSDGWRDQARDLERQLARMTHRAERLANERDDARADAKESRSRMLNQEGVAAAAEAERDEWKRRRDNAVETCRFRHQEGLTAREWHLKICGAAQATEKAEAEYAEEVQTSTYWMKRYDELHDAVSALAAKWSGCWCGPQLAHDHDPRVQDCPQHGDGAADHFGGVIRDDLCALLIDDTTPDPFSWGDESVARTIAEGLGVADVNEVRS